MPSQSAQATVFAEDDFSAEGSGSGWAAGDNWDIVSGGMAQFQSTFAYRNLAAPLAPFQSDVIYIAFDFQVPSGNGSGWGGAAFFEGPDGTGDESLFIGTSGASTAYSIDLKQGGTLPANQADGTPVDTLSHRLVVAIDFDDVNPTPPFQDDYSLWVDNNDQNAPNSETTINSPIDAEWNSVRLAGVMPMNFDNFVITDDPSVAFATIKLQLNVDKSTGEVSISNNTGADLDLSAYSITSGTGMLDVGSPAGDFNQDGVADGQDFLAWQRGDSPMNGSPGDLTAWQETYGESGGAGGWESLEDQDLSGLPAGDGSGNGWEEGDSPSNREIEEYFLTGSSSIDNGAAPISLGNAYGGGAAGSEDLVFTYRANGEIQTGIVAYVNGSAPAASAVPEPASLTMAALGCLGMICAARRRK